MTLVKSSSIIFAVLLLCFVTSGCGASAPSNTAVENAITESLQHKVPVPLGGAAFGEHDVRVGEIRLLKVGIPQGTEEIGKIWPVRVFVHGGYVANWDDKDYLFSGNAEYLFKKNKFDEWVATFANRAP